MMKKLIICCTGATLISLCSCSDGNKEISDFATKVATRIQAGQIDSVKAVYPDIELGDSIALAFSADSMNIIQSDSAYNVSLGGGASLTIKVADDGNMTVTSSKGLFKYTPAALSFAEKTGAFKATPDPTDAQLAEIMSNVESLSANLFDDYVAKRKNAIKNLGYTVTKDIQYMMDEGKGYFSLKNTTDQPISGDEYEITWVDSWAYSMDYGSKRRITEGIDIPANGIARYSSSFSGHSGSDIKAITMKIPSKDKFFETYTPTGDEYAEYIKTLVPGAAKGLTDGPYTMAGKLSGKHAIHMTINKGMTDGSYYYDKYGPSNTLGLKVKNFDKKTGRLTIEESNDKGQVTGSFNGTLTPE